jgi:hypothetical protein
MRVETPLKHESRRFQPEVRFGPPLLSRHTRAFAKRSGRRPLPERRFLMEASIWEILPCSRRRVAPPFDRRLGSDDRPVLERRVPTEAAWSGIGSLCRDAPDEKRMSTDQEVGDSSSSGRAAETPAVAGVSAISLRVRVLVCGRWAASGPRGFGSGCHRVV